MNTAYVYFTFRFIKMPHKPTSQNLRYPKTKRREISPAYFPVF